MYEQINQTKPISFRVTAAGTVFLPLLKHCRNLRFGIACRRVSSCSWITMTSWKWRRHNCDFILRNKKTLAVKPAK